jgi:hypothetical protein
VATAPAVRVEGLAALVRDLERYGVATGDLKDAFGAISADVAQEASSRINVQTGAHLATTRPARTNTTAVVRAGNAGNAPAAGVLNYARPGDEFLTGPANENLDDKVARIEHELDQLVKRYRLD